MADAVLLGGNGKGALELRGSPPQTARALKREPQDSETASLTTTRPKHIPAEMWTRKEEEIADFLQYEIGMATTERADLISKLARWKKAYAAPIPDTPKNFPIRNASNLPVPVIKEIVNTLAAQLVQSTLTARPRWVFDDLAKEWEEFKDEIEKFLDLGSDRDFNLDSAAIDWIIEAAKMGTSVMEVGYEVDVRKIYRYTPDGGSVYPKRKTYRDGPSVRRVPLQDFFCRFAEKDIQRARWVGKRIRLSPVEAKRWQEQGRLYGLEQIQHYYAKANEVDEADQKIADLEEFQPNFYEIYVVYASYDVDGDGKLEEVKLYYHLDSNTIVGRFFHPYDHGKRPFVVLRYFPHEDRFYGEGLCEMLEAIQEGISTKHNQRSDNATMANLKMIVKRKMLETLQPGDPLYTGKIISANDIWNDIREFQMAEIYPSTVQEEQILRNYAERLSGVNEAIMGSAMPVSRTTFGAQMALLQEQAKRIDLTVRSIRSGLNDVGWYVLMMYHQFGTHGKARAWLGEEDGMIVDGVFRLNRRVMELGIGLRMQVPTSIQNRQVKRENSIAMFNLLVQLYEKFLPIAQAMAPEALPAIVKEMANSAVHFMGDVLESFEHSNPEDILAGITVLERILPAAEDLGGRATYDRETERAEVFDKLSRLEDLYRSAQADSDRAVGISSGDERARRNTPPEGRVRSNDASIFFGGEPNLRS